MATVDLGSHTFSSSAAVVDDAATPAASSEPSASAPWNDEGSSCSDIRKTHCISFTRSSGADVVVRAALSANNIMPMRQSNAVNESTAAAATKPKSLNTTKMPPPPPNNDTTTPPAQEDVVVDSTNPPALEQHMAHMHVTSTGDLSADQTASPDCGGPMVRGGTTSTASRNSSVCSIVLSTPSTTPLSGAALVMRPKRNLAKTQSLDIVDEDLNEAQHAAAAASTSSSSCSLNLAGGKPIYPNVPYSPYGSPYGSPRGRKRQPLRESRRISIEHNESFLQLNQYKLYDKIGQGSYGLVKLAYSEEDSTHYAMKILSKKKLLRKAGLMGRGPKRGSTISPLDRVYREIAVLKKLDHPNVVKLVEVLDDPLEDSLYLVFELVELGAVLAVPSDTPLSEERAWNVFRDALLGLEYLHYQHIIHSDLKPDNLLVDKNGRVQIADLGVCNEFNGNDASMSNISTPGTPAFRAPETLQTGQHSYNGRAVDVWALGATLFALVYGQVPFVADNVPILYERIRTEPLRFPDDQRFAAISDRLRQLIARMLDKDPERRATLPQVKLDTWVTCDGAQLLPDEVTNCCALVDVTEDDISSVVTSIPKLDTLILIKNMLKKHSFQNPYATKSAAGQSRTERFLRAGRSNSAPGAYHGVDRQVSCDNLLPSVSEVVGGTSERLIEEEAQDA